MRKTTRKTPQTLRTNAEHSAEMRRKLTAVARREFARAGYAATGTERIVRLARVTRGALYHHYEDKRALFEAVFQALAAEIAERIEVSAVRAKSPFAALVAGCDAWLDACLDPDVQQIVLIDGPSVLGYRRWSEIDAQHGTRLLQEGIVACIDAGVFASVDAGVLTRLLAGALNDAALSLAQADDAAALRRRIGPTFRRLLDGLAR